MRHICQQRRSNAVFRKVDLSQPRLAQKVLELTNNRAVHMKWGWSHI